MGPHLRDQMVEVLRDLVGPETSTAESEISALLTAKVPESCNVTLPTSHQEATPEIAPKSSPSSPTKSSISEVRKEASLKLTENSKNSEQIEKSNPNATQKSQNMPAPSKLKLTVNTGAKGRDPPPSNGSSLPQPLDPSQPGTSAGSTVCHLRFVRVVGATPKAFQLLHSSNHTIEDVTIIHTTPTRIDDSDCDEVFQFAGCTYDELLRLGSSSHSSSSKKKKKKNNKKKNKKKKALTAAYLSAAAAGQLEYAKAAEEAAKRKLEKAKMRENVEWQLATGGFPLAVYSTEGEKEPGTPNCEGNFYSDSGSDDEYVSDEDRPYADDGTGRRLTDEEMLTPVIIEPCGHQIESFTRGLARDVLAMVKPLRNTRHSLVRSDILLDKDFKFECVPQSECGVVTSWDDLREVIATVFPYDAELQVAFSREARDSLDLWKFIVKYGMMYKDFVCEVLEMVNELKKGLVDAMDLHREKTTEILETHKREMSSAVERAQIADARIDELEDEVKNLKVIGDEHRMKAMTHEEEVQKLQRDLTASNRKIKELENAQKEFVAERLKAAEENRTITDNYENVRKKLSESKSQCESLRSRVTRWRESAEEAEYKMRDLEIKVCDDREEMDKLRDRNQTLNKKVDSLQSEISRLKDKLAKQKKELAAKRPSPSKVAPIAHPEPIRSVSSFPITAPPAVAAPGPRNTFFPNPLRTSPPPKPPVHPEQRLHSNSSLFPPSLANIVGGSVGTRGFAQNELQSSMCSKSFPSNDTRERPRPTYAAASAGPSREASFLGSSNFHESSMQSGNSNMDTEVHSLLTPNEPPLNNRSNFLSSTDMGTRNLYGDIASSFASAFNDLQSNKQENMMSSSSQSNPSQLLDEQLSYNPWGERSTFGYSQESLSTLFDIKPRSSHIGNNESTSNDSFNQRSQDRFLDPNPLTLPSDLGFGNFDRNVGRHNSGYHNPNNRPYGS